MSTINEIVQRFSKSYLNEYSDRMLPSHRKALEAIAKCRTEAMGWHREWCTECDAEFLVFHSSLGAPAESKLSTVLCQAYF